MLSERRETVGWDIGGVHVKGARVMWRAGEIDDVRAAIRPFEIWQGPDKLPAVLGEVAAELGIQGGEAMAVTMTAELSDAFRTKREGVLFVLDEIERVFPGHPLHVLGIAGDLVPLESARRRPLDFAATNWVAAALFVADRYRDCILIDVGSTTTDIIPIRGGGVVAKGRTDLARLASGELVYTGVVRTNPNTLADAVPVRGRMCRVAAEYFTVMADVYLLLGRLSPEEYTCPTPDNRARSLTGAAERLARLVCADGEMLSEEEVLKIASYLYERQLRQISEGLLQVLSRLDNAYEIPLVVAGAGSFVAAEVGRRLRLGVLGPEHVPGGVGCTALPALAAACLLAGRWGNGSHDGRRDQDRGRLGRGEHLRTLCEKVAELGQRHRLLIVPGGGAFADVVRQYDARFGLGDSAAHWMAILAMDQYGYLLADLIPGSTFVRSMGEAREVVETGSVPVLLPFGFLRQADALPHSWSVTSDSIAAWVAGLAEATLLVLLKDRRGLSSPVGERVLHLQAP